VCLGARCVYGPRSSIVLARGLSHRSPTLDEVVERCARPMVMGVLNVTPDSFSDGGCFLHRSDAVAHGRLMFAEGADVVDVGGESSRPGAEPVDEREELRRVVPVVEELSTCGRVSVDTVKAAVARRAVAAGASLVNDISGSLYEVAAELGVGWVGMHMRGKPKEMQRLACYDDVFGDVRAQLVALADAAQRAGVGEIWLDPGIGFAKDAGHNLILLARIAELSRTAEELGHRLLVGTSRKSFLGLLTAPPGQSPPPAGDRLEASLATAVWAMVHGARMVRAHDVRPTVQAARLVCDERERPGATAVAATGTTATGSSR
jgi:dihydropteroate synthase